MNFTLTVTAEHVNAIFSGLNKLEHGQVRGTFDHLLKQIQEQEAAAATAKPAPVQENNQSAGLSD